MVVRLSKLGNVCVEKDLRGGPARDGKLEME